MAKQIVLEIDANTSRLEAKLKTIPEKLEQQTSIQSKITKLDADRTEQLKSHVNLLETARAKALAVMENLKGFSTGIRAGAVNASLVAMNKELEISAAKLKQLADAKTELLRSQTLVPKVESTFMPKNTGGYSYLGGGDPRKKRQQEEELALAKIAQEQLLKMQYDLKQKELAQNKAVDAQIHKEEMTELRRHIEEKYAAEADFLRRKNLLAVKQAKEYVAPKVADTREITSALPNAQKIYQDLFGSAKSQLAQSVADGATKSARLLREEVHAANIKLQEQKGHFAEIAKHIGGIIGLYRVYNALINTSIAALASIPQTGIQLETTSAALTATFGSLGAAAKELAFLTAESKRTGLAVGVLRENYAQASASFIAAGESAETTRQIFSNLNTVAATLHLNQDKTSSIYLALSQIFNKTKLQAEELTKQLAQTIPGVTNQQAKALTISVSDLYDKMKKGAISAHDAVLALSNTLEETYGGNGFEVAAKGLNAELGRLSTSWTLLAENLYKISEGAMKSVVRGAANLLEYFTELTSNTSGLAVSFKTLTTVFSGFLIGSLAGYAATLATSIASTATFAGTISLTRAATIGLGAALTNLKTLMATNWLTIAAAVVGTLAANFVAAKNAAQDMEDKITETIKKVAAYSTPEGKYQYDIESNPVIKELNSQIAYQEATVKALQEQAIKLSNAKGIAGANAAKELEGVNAQIETKLAELKYLKAAYATEYAAIVNGPKLDAPLKSTTDITADLARIQEDTFKTLGDKQESAALAYLRRNAKIMENLRKAMSEENNAQAEEARKGLAQIHANAEAIRNKEDTDKTYNSSIANINKILAASSKSNKNYMEEIDNQYNANLISVRQYYAEKAQIIADATKSETSLAKEKVAQTQLAGRSEEEITAAQAQYDSLIEERKKITEKFNQERTLAEREFGRVAQASGLDIIGMTKNQADGIAALRDEYDKLSLSARQYYEKTLRAQNLPENQIQISMSEFDRTATARLQNSVQEEQTSKLKSYVNTLRSAKEEMTSLGDVSQSVFASSFDGVGKLAGAFQLLTTTIRENSALLQENANMQSINDADRASGAESYLTWLHNKYDLEEKAGKLEKKTTADQVTGLSQVAGAAASMFSKKSSAAKALHSIEMGLAVARMAMNAKEMAQTAIKTVTDVASGAAKMFSQSGWLGFAGVAAMLAVMAALGFAGSSGGNAGYIPDSPDSGTVLGDNQAKSKSTENTYQLLKDIHAKEYAELRGINDGVSRLSKGITSWVGQFFRSGGLSKLSAEQFIAKDTRTQIDPIGKKLENMLMGTPKIVAQGIYIAKQSLELIGQIDIIAKEFADIEKKGLLSSSKTTVFRPLKQVLIDGLTDVFSAARDTLRTTAIFFGADLQDVITNYMLPKIKINLKGKNAEKAAEKMTNVISTALDKMTATVMGDVLSKYQQLGEGLYETAIRVQAQVAVARGFFTSINSGIVLSNTAYVNFTETLIEFLNYSGSAADKLKELQKSLADFYKTFTPTSVQNTNNFIALADNLALAFSKLKGTNANDLVSGFYAAIKGSSNLSEAIYQFVETLKETDAATIAEMINISDAAKEMVKLFTDAVKPVKDQITTLTESIDVTPIADLMAALTNSRDITEQTRLVNTIQKKVMDKYNTELSAIKTIKNAFVSLAETVKKLLLGDLSTLDPRQKLEEAQKQYTDLLIASRSSDVTAAAAAASKLGSSAEEYLRQAKSYYGATATYAAIFASVTTTLSDLSISQNDANQQIVDATKALAEGAITELQNLSITFADAFTAYLQAQIAAQTEQQQAPREQTFLEGLYKNYAATFATTDKADNKEELRKITAFNLGGMALYNAVISNDIPTIKAIAAAAKLTLKTDETELKAKQSLLKAATTVDEKTQLQADIAILKAKIKKDKTLIKFKANGGSTSGLTMVGERGPELLNLPAGTNVVNNTNTQRMLATNDRQSLEYLAGIKNELSLLNSRMEVVERKTRLGAKA